MPWMTQGPSLVDDGVQTAGGIATVAAAVVAAVGVLLVWRQLRSQTAVQQLESVLATNDLWRLVQSAVATKIKLRNDTVSAIIEAHHAISPNVVSVLQRNGSPAIEIEASVPFILGSLQTAGIADMANAPDSNSDYAAILRSRGRVVGYTLAKLTKMAEGSDTAAQIIAEDLRHLREGVEKYVSVVNEVSELYEADLLNRRLFLGKRHVALAQQCFFVEPYVLWRNSVDPGRWGLRLLSMGEEAREYHCIQVLQQSAVRARNDPPSYAPDGTYGGFNKSVGWMLGPGRVSDRAWRATLSEWQARHRLGKAFTPATKRRHNTLVSAMPRTAGSGYGPPANDRWDDLVLNPDRLIADTERIRNGAA